MEARSCVGWLVGDDGEDPTGYTVGGNGDGDSDTNERVGERVGDGGGIVGDTVS